MTYAGMSADKSQDVAIAADISFATKQTVVTVKNTQGNSITGVPVTYAGSSWLNFGSTDASGVAVKELIPGNYTFRATYNGKAVDKKQNTNIDPMVTIQF
jgi:hypothetical protein